MFQALANPHRFLKFSETALPVATVVALVLVSVALVWGLFFSPEDAVQGASARIMYVHVPAAWWGSFVYGFMVVASLMSLVWRHLLADAAARAAAPIGAAFAGLCLVTGSLWGAPTWGAFWVWDARLTSMLVLFITYLGYMALWAAVEDEAKAARLAAILCLAGAINLPIVKFSVDWWQTLHQPASLLRAGGSAIHPSMLWPLLVGVAGFGAAFAALEIAGVRAEVLRRQALSPPEGARMSDALTNPDAIYVLPAYGLTVLVLGALAVLTARRLKFWSARAGAKDAETKP